MTSGGTAAPHGSHRRGARGNPGLRAMAWSCMTLRAARLAELSEYLGHHTNNYAEYQGLLGVLRYALANGVKALKVVSDSELMVRQMKGSTR